MLNTPLRRSLLLTVLCSVLTVCSVAGQSLTFPTNTNKFGMPLGIDAIGASAMDTALFRIDSQNPDNSPLQSRSGAVSKLDLKAPWKAQREYEKGFQLLMRKDYQRSVEHLTKAIGFYPSFVAAHNALGTAYLNLNQNEQARDAFAKAVALDDHLPNSFLNLGCAHLALKQYPEAEESLRKASTIAPLDLTLLKAAIYAEFANHDYPAVLQTASEVHSRKHDGAAIVHYFAAGAFGAQDNLVEAQHEMETLLKEDPKSPQVQQFREILGQIKTQQVQEADAKLHPAQPPESVKFSFDQPTGPTAAEATQQAQQVLQNLKTKNEIAEAEAEPEATCAECGTVAPGDAATASQAVRLNQQRKAPGSVFRAAVDEVAIFFAATDHGRSVTDLTASDIGVRDDSRPPDAILGFRNESQLPLRLGLIIDTSNSITTRFAFEQAAANKFLQGVVTDKNDLAFVVGVNNSVLLVQDFTSDQMLTARAVNELAPGGGTALWDAVSFGAEKLAGRAETQPVARILVVISDGQDNSSSVTLKQAIADAQHGEVAVYTVSTRELYNEDQSAVLGDHALATLSELTGGAAFVPGSLGRLKGSLADLQQVIRGRYLVTYKPASFERNGHYRTIDVTAQKAGHKLRVYARKGYYASVAHPTVAAQ